MSEAASDTQPCIYTPKTITTSLQLSTHYNGNYTTQRVGLALIGSACDLKIIQCMAELWMHEYPSEAC